MWLVHQIEDRRLTENGLVAFAVAFAFSASSAFLFASSRSRFRASFFSSFFAYSSLYLRARQARTLLGKELVCINVKTCLHTSQLCLDIHFLNIPKRARLDPWDYLQRGNTFERAAPSGTNSFCIASKLSMALRKEGKPSKKWKARFEIVLKRYTCKTYRTGRPPILDTAASQTSASASRGPSGIPRLTEVSTSE
jgi:hypothetical protein